MSKVIEIDGERFSLEPIDTMASDTDEPRQLYALQPIQDQPQEPEWEVKINAFANKIVVWVDADKTSQDQAEAIKEKIEQLLREHFNDK